MREILFKAKRVSDGEWVEGYLGKFDNPDGTTDLIIVPSNEVCANGISWYVINENTICQYTGLTDKNGRKIWENDILRYSYDYENSHWLKAKGLKNEDIKYSVGAVFWQAWRGLWAVCGKGKSKACNQDVYKYSRNPNRVTVIGNIFDNPELV